MSVHSIAGPAAVAASIQSNRLTSSGPSFVTIGLMVSTFVLVVVQFSRTRKRLPNEPPLVPGVAFFGSGFDFQKDAVKFLLDCGRKYGRLFTIQLPMNYLHILQDPHSYNEFTRHRPFDFDPIQRMVNKNVFNFHLKDASKIIREASRVAQTHQLTESLKVYSNFLEESYLSMEKQMGSKKNTIMPLKNLLVATQFRAIFNAIFGASDDTAFNHHDAHIQFDIFHRSFNYLWLGFPLALFPGANRAMKTLTECHPSAAELLARPDLSLYMRNALQRMEATGQTKSDVLGHNLVYLHVNYNTVKITYWLLAFIMQQPEAYQALREEIETLCCGEEEVIVDIGDINAMEVLDSIVKESFRCASGVLMIREITQDTKFTLKSGESFHMRKNDKVAIYPPALHHDPEIFEHPNDFQYNRFIDRQFYKDGQQIQKPLLPFGSLCPGQKISIAQIKLFALSFLAQHDIELVDGAPQFNKNCYGHEILPPLKDVNILVKRRECPTNVRFVVNQDIEV